MTSFIQIQSGQGLLWVRADLQERLERFGLSHFEDWMGLRGIEFLEISMRPTRPVVALSVPDLTQTVFLKRHLEEPRTEAIMERLGWIPPQSEARKEAGKLHLFSQGGIHVPEVVAWGEGVWEGLRRASFLATLDLEALPLERYLFRNWKPPVARDMALDKRRTIQALALLTRRMHQAGLVHRDFYLGHIFVHGKGGEGFLSVIDVQRASERPSWWIRSRIKDLASLHFSSDPHFVRKADRIRFLKTYWAAQRLRFWHRWLLWWIERKAWRIRRHTEKAMGIPYEEFFKNKYY
jgi:heptose I phosphotransferase